MCSRQSSVTVESAFFFCATSVTSYVPGVVQYQVFRTGVESGSPPIGTKPQPWELFSSAMQLRSSSTSAAGWLATPDSSMGRTWKVFSVSRSDGGTPALHHVPSPVSQLAMDVPPIFTFSTSGLAAAPPRIVQEMPSRCPRSISHGFAPAAHARTTWYSSTSFAAPPEQAFFDPQVPPGLL